MVLGEGDVVDGFGFGFGGFKFGVYLEDEVFVVFFFFEDFKSSGFVFGGDNIVGNFFGDDVGGGDIDNVGKSNYVVEVVYVVGIFGVGISLSEIGVFNVGDIVNYVNFVFFGG